MICVGSVAISTEPLVVLTKFGSAMSNFIKQLSENGAFLVLCSLLIASFAMGGSARSDPQSLAVLRPLAVLALGFGIWKLRIEHFRKNKEISTIAALLAVFSVAFLVPLPSGLLGGSAQEMVANVNATANISTNMRPLAISGSTTLNANFALLIPLAALVLLVQLDRNQRFSLLPLCIALGMGSSLLGLLQSIGGSNGSLYFYDVTNNGSAVGFFANRNHQALFLAILFPMLATYYVTADKKDHRLQKYRLWLALIGSIVLIPLILITGSRSGLFAGLFGILAAFWIFRHRDVSMIRGKKKDPFNWRILLAAGGVAALTAVTLAMARAEAIFRLFAPPVQTDDRVEFWQVIWDAGYGQLLWGVGPGGFADLYELLEPKNLLDASYLNHAHNDFLELLVDYGVLGVILVIATAVLFFNCYRKVDRVAHSRDQALRFLGIICMVMLLLGSAVDYPLRTPFISVLATILFVWSCGSRLTSKNEPHTSKLVD